MENVKDLIILFNSWTEEEILSINKFPRSGSNRKYYRIRSSSGSVIGVINNNRKENEAFVYFSNHFKSKELNVPIILISDLDKHVYLQEDLGDNSLYDLVVNDQKGGVFSEGLVNYYKQALSGLIKFQINGHDNLDYSKCFPEVDFSEEYMSWDLNYFKYYFLKFSGIEFDEKKLNDEFLEIINYLAKAPANYFMYRDFQSRNIIVKNDELFFIDYQGGRKGALQYDVASLLYQAKANIPDDIKTELLNFYITELEKSIQVDKDEFIGFYYGFVALRIIQTLGAYGFRGLFERKPHFIQSVPFALKNLHKILNIDSLNFEIPYLKELISKIKDLPLFAIQQENDAKLNVSISSFSYQKRGIPVDYGENGGGYVFDCRALPNPGRHIEYKRLTGKDKEVIEFFKDKTELEDFYNNVIAMVSQSVNNYLERGFKSLSVNFGCTGGQHRSVYSAEKLSKYLKQNFNVVVNLKHLEEENWDIVRL